jgi:hypothetical protein
MRNDIPSQPFFKKANKGSDSSWIKKTNRM